MNTYCTIISADFLPYARVLHDSLNAFEPGTTLQVLVAAENTALSSSTGTLVLHPAADVLQSPIAKSIYKKYAGTNSDHLRWALKPVFISYLLNRFDKVIFVDPDIHFTGPHAFLFNLLDQYSVLLSPHGGNPDPLEDPDGLYSMLRNGLYSGGFVGASQKGKQSIGWWADMCHFRMDQVKELGLYDDQKYLDMIPVLDPNAGLLRHDGCNLANINIKTQPRQLVAGKPLVHGQLQPVFVHFTRDTISNIRNGNDAALRPILESYLEDLKKAGAPQPTGELTVNRIQELKRKTLVRTRLKRFFYNLARKL